MEKKKVSTANGAGITGCQQVEGQKQIHTYPHAENSSPNVLKT